MVEMGKFASLILYLAVYIVSAYFMSKSKITETKKIDFLFVIAILLPVLLAANRYYVGTDFENYYFMYRRMSRCPFVKWVQTEMSFEGIPLGIWLISRIAFQFRSYQVFYGLLAACIYVPAALMLKRQYPKDITFYAVFMFLTSQFTSGFNIGKQIAAVVFLMAGMQFVHERKFWKFLLMCFLSFCFHPSALIALPIYFLWKPEDSGFSFKRILFVTACVVFITFTPHILTFLGGRFESYTIYTDEISNKSFYLNAAWFVFFFIMRRRYVEFDYRNDLYITMLLLGLLLNISGFTSPYIKRIAMYYTFPQFLLIFQTPYIFTESDKTFMKTMVWIYTVLMFVLNFYVFEFSDILPYKFSGGI